MRGGGAGLGRAHPEPLLTLPWMEKGAQMGAGGVAFSRWALSTESRLGTPRRGCAWPPLWETWGKKRKAPSLGKDCGPHCGAASRSGRSQFPPL